MTTVTKRLSLSLSKGPSLGLALTAAALLLLPGSSLAATTCAEVRAQNPAAQDGTYSLTLGSQQVALYCHDMAGTPREYLTLPNTGSTTNYSYYGRGSNTSPIGLTTGFTKVRLYPAMLRLQLDDFTFSASQGWASFGANNYVYHQPLASAGDCVGGWSQTGRSNIDLMGTPFDIVPGQFQLSGYIPDGTVTPIGSQAVNLTGGGICGGIGAPDNQLQLTLRSAPEPAPELVHRYSFSTSGADSVSGADGTLMGGATIAHGEVVLNGAGAYVSLPISGTVASLQSATFEAWVKWDSAAGQTWARLFDFNDGGDKSLFLTPRNGRFDSGPAMDTPRFAISTQFISGEQQATSASAFPVGALTYVAVTLDGAAGITRLYVNGIQVAQKNTTLTPAHLGSTPNNWLGRSRYPADPFLKGSISEFRVYRTALSPSRIAAHSSAGPDQLDDEQAPAPCTSGEPRLVLNGSSPLTLECGSSPYSDPGAQAFDGCGNPIQVHAYNTGTDVSGPGPNTSNEGSYSVSYAAWDAMGHTVSAIRTVNVEDRTAPSLQLIGPAFMTHTCGSQWADPGVQAADACYGNVSAQVQHTGEVNGWAPGTYTVTYWLTDSGGNSATPVTRTVQVANCPW
jgi:hypothetical protein